MAHHHYHGCQNYYLPAENYWGSIFGISGNNYLGHYLSEILGIIFWPFQAIRIRIACFAFYIKKKPETSPNSKIACGVFFVALFPPSRPLLLCGGLAVVSSSVAHSTDHQSREHRMQQGHVRREGWHVRREGLVCRIWRLPPIRFLHKLSPSRTPLRDVGQRWGYRRPVCV